MLYSKLFGKTSREATKKFESVNHELLTKAGFIDQISSGIFTLLPLGKKVLVKIENIIRQEINNIGGQEILMPLLSPKANWLKTKRWDTVDVLFKTKSRFDQEYAIAPTHEEIVTPLAKKYVNSYRDLPLALYHITTKFRDEPRPKSGILRGKEFGMKDLYSFHTTKEDLLKYYKIVTEAYLKIFERCGFKDVKVTEASGGSFTKKFSHEFNVLTPAGEVNLIYCDKCKFTQNEEVAKQKSGEKCQSCKTGEIKKTKAIEIGNIFDLETKFSDDFDFKFTDEGGKKQPVIMGCYGIGTTRVLGTVVEIHHDEKGIVWPEEITPYKVHLIGLDLANKEIKNKAENVYQELLDNKIEVLYDDREDLSAGQKFAAADLIGIPYRLVVSKRTKDKIEIKQRSSNEATIITVDQAISKIKN